MTAKVAVITGGGGGIGLACARKLADEHRLLLSDIDERRLAEAQTALRADGTDADIQRLDAADPDSVRELAARCEALGELGALVHTAGLSPSMADGPRIWAVNLVGTAHLMDAFRPLVRTGSVAVLIASQAGHLARLGMTPEAEALIDEPLAPDFVERLCSAVPGFASPEGAYGGSKFGVQRLALREAAAWGATGARVVSLSPGIVDTGMGQQEYASQPFMQTMIDNSPLGRMGRADEIASVVAFLCSEAASFVTATDVLVDGGSTAPALETLNGLRRT